ncbi:MAG: hypothetical protein R6V27_09510 [Balneolaceae bacterium]
MMHTFKIISSTAILFFALIGTAAAQDSLSETFKEHFNKTVQNVKAADNPAEQRDLLNTSFDKMIDAVDHIDESADLTDEERSQILSFKDQIEEKKSELNGLDGFDEVQDDELIDFSDYSQQEIEQANRTITFSLTTALLIVLILLLL